MVVVAGGRGLVLFRGGGDRLEEGWWVTSRLSTTTFLRLFLLLLAHHPRLLLRAGAVVSAMVVVVCLCGWRWVGWVGWNVVMCACRSKQEGRFGEEAEATPTGRGAHCTHGLPLPPGCVRGGPSRVLWVGGWVAREWKGLEKKKSSRNMRPRRWHRNFGKLTQPTSSPRSLPLPPTTPTTPALEKHKEVELVAAGAIHAVAAPLQANLGTSLHHLISHPISLPFSFLPSPTDPQGPRASPPSLLLHTHTRPGKVRGQSMRCVNAVCPWSV